MTSNITDVENISTLTDEHLTIRHVHVLDKEPASLSRRFGDIIDERSHNHNPPDRTARVQQ